MRRYSETDETIVRLQAHVREWIRSSLLDEAQRDSLFATMPTDLRRTNIFLRAILLVFGVLITIATVGLISLTFGWRSETAFGVLCICSGVVCYFAADTLIERWRLYRFGVEEALASMAVVLTAFGCGVVGSDYMYGYDFRGPMVIGLAVGCVGAYLAYLRFGYLYSAVAAMGCLALIPFQIGHSEWAHRAMSAGILMAVFLVLRNLWRKQRNDFHGDEYSILQAFAFGGIYLALNLHVEEFFSAGRVPRLFYWGTYVLIWILPAAGLALSLSGRVRPLLMVSLAMSLTSLATNKPYLGREHQTWDPILFGLLLISVAVAVRRWLASGPDSQRYGFSAARILESERRMISMVGTASAALHVGTIGTPDQPAKLETGGGRSGGGGASGQY
jgi:cytochrome b561